MAMASSDSDKLFCWKQVERCDAAEAVRLLEVALQQSATDHATGALCHSFYYLGKYCSYSILKWCSGKVSLDKHLGEHTLGEILFGKVFKLNLGR
jgi:hypothetical protein